MLKILIIEVLLSSLLGAILFRLVWALTRSSLSQVNDFPTRLPSYNQMPGLLLLLDVTHHHARGTGA